MKVKVISLPYIFQVLYVLCFTRPRYQVSVYRTIGPLDICILWGGGGGGYTVSLACSQFLVVALKHGLCSDEVVCSFVF